MSNPYRNALECQDACNLSGVVRQLARDTEALWAEARKREQGTDYVNTHPVVRAYLSKLCQLAGIEDPTDPGDAFRGCAQQLADAGEPPVRGWELALTPAEQAEVCPVCNGSGAQPGGVVVWICQNCKGTGKRHA